MHQLLNRKDSFCQASWRSKHLPLLFRYEQGSTLSFWSFDRCTLVMEFSLWAAKSGISFLVELSGMEHGTTQNLQRYYHLIHKHIPLIMFGQQNGCFHPWSIFDLRSCFWWSCVLWLLQGHGECKKCTIVVPGPKQPIAPQLSSDRHETVHQNLDISPDVSLCIVELFKKAKGDQALLSSCCLHSVYLPTPLCGSRVQE